MLKDSTNATGLPESESGHMRCDSLAGQTTDLFGQVHVPASHSAPPASRKASLTTGISGRRGFGSSESADLSRSLESRLRPRLDSLGSTLWRLIWSRQVTPAGRRIFALRARAHRTSASDFTGWPTPDTPSGGRTVPPGTTATGRKPDGSKAQVTLENVADLAGWPTPMAGTPAQKGYNEAGNTDSGRKTVELVAGWATPRAEDAESAGMRHGRGVADTLTAQASLSGWNTPAVSDSRNVEYSNGNRNKKGKPYTVNLRLPGEVKMAGWGTPSSRDWKDTPGMAEKATNPDGTKRTRLDQLGRQAHLADSGRILSGSPVGTVKPGQLNPAFSLWLQGLPPEWGFCGARAIRSLRRSRRNS